MQIAVLLSLSLFFCHMCLLVVALKPLKFIAWVKWVCWKWKSLLKYQESPQIINELFNIYFMLYFSYAIREGVKFKKMYALLSNLDTSILIWSLWFFQLSDQKQF
jgi:hypothetical protein